MDNEQHKQQKYHHYYTTFATISEFVIAFSLHILATFKITAVAMLLGAATFLLYQAVEKLPWLSCTSSCYRVFFDFSHSATLLLFEILVRLRRFRHFRAFLPHLGAIMMQEHPDFASVPDCRLIAPR